MPKDDIVNKFSQSNMQELLKIASKKLGMTPEQLHQTIADPQKAEELITRIGGPKSEQYKSAMKSSSSIEQLPNSNPKAKKLLEELLGDKNNG